MLNKVNIILKFILSSRGTIIRKRLNILQVNYPCCYNYILNYFDDSSCIEETINRLKFNITSRFVCEYCGQPVKWIRSNKYSRHCCTKCSSLDKNVQLKSKKTCLKKYGADRVFKSDNFKEKTKQTCLEKYGKEYVTQTDKQKLKSKLTKLNNYGLETYNNIDKAKKTKLELYGNENYNNRNKTVTT